MKQHIGLLVASIAVASLGCSEEAPDNGSGGSGTGGAGVAGSPSAGTPGTNGGHVGSAGSGKPQGGSAGSGDNQGNGGATSAGSGGQALGGQAGANTGGQSSAGGPNGGSGGATPRTDVFGIPMLKPSRTPSLLWTSQHWATGSARNLSGRDPSDPTGWSIRRGDTSAMAVDGKGVMSMGGAQPRFYVMPKSGESAPFFKNIEFTGYYRRTANDGAFNAGFVVGMRSHPEGHGSDTCNTTTYYLAFRNSGTYLFDKELNHPNDSPGKSGQMFSPSASVPVGKWIGMKYIVYNLPGDKAVKLETYIDANSNGNGTKLSDWKKIGETTDDGDWEAPTGDCGFPANTVVTEGGGVVFIRNTDVGKVEYTKLSWREITN
jgi:hypothetical protein